MHRSLPPLSDIRLVLITEAAEFFDGDSVFQLDLEAMSVARKNELVTAIEGLGIEVVHYPSPDDFLKKIAHHRDDLVLAPWSGAGSANRLSLIPAICEAASINYIGADATTRAICNDKDLSKVIARKSGFRTAPGVRLIPGDHIDLASTLRFPVIVKPCAEGTSIGIDQKSVCDDRADVQAMVDRLWNRGFDHVLVEEFIVGREICLCLMGDTHNPNYFGAVEVTLADKKDYLRTHPYDARIKKGFWGQRQVSRLETAQFQAEMERAKRAYRFLSRVQLFRVDGRLNDNGEFIFIEFATLPTFGKTSELTVGLSHHFGDYEQFISAVLSLR
jgi:D-alanine-D-alanine ligase